MGVFTYCKSFAIMVEMENQIKLRQAGFRLTQSRKKILTVLASKPQTAAQIVTTMKRKKQTIDLATVYRNLELLVGLGLANKVTFADQTARFELAGPHHHHLICKTCGSIEDIAMDESNLLASVRRRSKFEVTSHNLEFFGLCPNCQ